MVKWYESRERRVSSIPPLRSWLVILIPADVCIRPSVWVCASVVKQNPCSVSGWWAWSPGRSFFFPFIWFVLLGCVACLSIGNHRRRGRIRTCRKEGWKRLTGVQWMVVNDRIHSSATIIIIGLKSSIYLQRRLGGDHTAFVKPCAKCPIKTQKMFRSL